MSFFGLVPCVGEFFSRISGFDLGALWSAAMGGVVEPISIYPQELVAESCMVSFEIIDH